MLKPWASVRAKSSYIPPTFGPKDSWHSRKSWSWEGQEPISKATYSTIEWGWSRGST